MGDTTGISWCDRTWNGWIGCTKVSAGCTNCYADRDNKRYKWVDEWGPRGIRRRTSEANWKKPLHWNKERWIQCEVCAWRGATRDDNRLCPVCLHPLIRVGAPTRQRVFAFSLADVFEVNEQTRNWLWDFGQLIDATPNLDWMLLTKRPEAVMQLLIDYMAGEMAELWLDRHPNVWLGTSVEDQATADQRIPELMKIPAEIRWLSVEPQLARVNLRQIEIEKHDVTTLSRGATQTYEIQTSIDCLTGYKSSLMQKIHWVVVGGESGPGHRPFDPEWARAIRDDCRAARVPFFMKQLGGWPNKHEQLDEIPEDLRIREWPISPSQIGMQDARQVPRRS